MSDLVNRQEVIDMFKYYTGLNMTADEAYYKILYVLYTLPSVEPERKTGKWISVESNTVNGICSVCGYESHLYENDVYGEHYCPNCGAKMENE